jgi:hypothetical protein
LGENGLNRLAFSLGLITVPTISILINNYHFGPWSKAPVEPALKQTRPPDETGVFGNGRDDDAFKMPQIHEARIRLVSGAIQWSHVVTLSTR